jgi:hypothetical protein
MGKIYKACPSCLQEITIKPVLQKLQGRYSILCPLCFAHRSQWRSKINDAILSWNTYMREEVVMPLNIRPTGVKQGYFT